MQRLPMNSLDAARRTLSRIIREYKSAPEDQREHSTFRNTIYAFSVLLSYFKAEIDEDLERRVTELERLIKGE